MTSGLETIARGNSSRIAQPRRVVARSEDEWRALWSAHAGPEVPAPWVDFATRVVAAVFIGERPTSGYSVAIDRATRDGDALLLEVEVQHPPQGAITAQVITSPFHIAAVPRYDEGPIRFTPSIPSPDSRAPSPESPVASPERKKHGFSPSSTGLTPPVAGALAYLAGPFSGALIVAVERSSRFVKFHAWQALVGLGVLGIAATFFLILAFVMLLMSPAAFWVMLWCAAITAVVWVAAWAVCLVQAYRGRLWKLPLAGPYAERRAGLAP
jgi:uncharacterized membrane protein